MSDEPRVSHRVGFAITHPDDYADATAELEHEDELTSAFGGPAGIEYFDWWNDGGPFAPGEDHRGEEWAPPPWTVKWSTTNRGFAICAYKRFLVYAVDQGWLDFGDADKLTVDAPYFGGYLKQAVAAWQRQHGVEVSGRAGYTTTKSMCHKLFERDQARYGIPDNLACKLMDLESAFYPASFNDGGDWWLGQQHYPTSGNPPPNPDDRSRFGYNTGLICRELDGYHDQLKRRYPSSSEADLWRAAVFSYNAPAFAPLWLEAGFPETGGRTITVGDWQGPMFEWATLYTRGVISRSC